MTETIGIYYQTKNETINLYCEDCKPAGTSHHGSLVVSAYDHFCAGCGKDFKELAIEAEAQEQAAWDNHQMGY